MSLDKTTPDLLAAAQAAFDANDQSNPILKRKEISSDAWRSMFSPYDHVGNFITRGQVFGLFDKDVVLETGIEVDSIRDEGVLLPTSEKRVFDCLTLQMDFPFRELKTGQTSNHLNIYKDHHSGQFYTGLLFGKTFTRNPASKDGLTEAEVYMAIFEWAKNFATDVHQKRGALVDTMSNKDFPASSKIGYFANAFLRELTSYLNRTFG